MVMAFQLFLVEDTGAILTHSHGACVGAGVDIQYTRHLVEIIFLT
jgi:hypothetical protein